MSLPQRMPFADIWTACDRNDWLTWLTDKFGLGGATTVEETRELTPWESMAKALANPPKEAKCEYCDESFFVEALSHGYCPECQIDVLRFYLQLKAGGTPHSPEELARVKALLDAETGGSGLQK